MTRFLAPVCWLIVCLVVLALASSAGAQPTAEFWEELGGSASGDGLSASTVGLPTGNRHVSVAIGPDGRPVVAYADGDTIRVRRWTGTAWEAIGPSGTSGGLPQIVTDTNGRMYLAWRQFASTLSWEVFLLARDWNGTAWQPLGTSASGGGISGAEGAAGVPAFSLVLDAAGTPWVAYQTATLRWGDFTNRVADLDLGTQQIYVRRWTGATWEFVGSDRQGGGASNALSFRVDEPGRTTTFASHSAEHPALAIDQDGRPIVAFIYSSTFSGGNPPEFNGENDDMYAVRWNGTAWAPLGPALPTAPVGPGLGAPGGISNTPGWVREVGFDRLVRPSLIVDHDGAPVLAWGETVWQESPETDGFRRIHVHRWNGTAWHGLGSPSGEIDLISYAYDTSLALGTTGPILAWPRGGGDLSWIAVLAFDTAEGRWRELGQGSVGPGISVPGDRAFNPRVAVNSAGVPTVAWIDLTPAVPQAYLRRFDEPQAAPDVDITAFSAPAFAHAGGSLVVRHTLVNTGTRASGAISLQFFLSTDDTLGADALLHTRALGSLAAGASSSLETTLTVPASTAAPAAYRVIALASLTQQSDRDPSNNGAVSAPIDVTGPAMPDLVMTTLTVPASGVPGRSLAIADTVRNVGARAAGAFTIRFYLSSDAAHDPGDVLLGARSLAGLAIGASSSAVTTVTIPAATPVPSTYRVIAVADALGQQAESDETNNTAASTGPVALVAYRPDLAFTALTMPAAGAAGRPLAVSSTVRNTGVAPAGAFTVRFFLSGDATLDDADVLLGARTVGSLAAGAASTAVTTLTIPATTPVPAAYRVIGVVDALNQQTELNETDNTRTSAAAVSIGPYRPDLTLTTLTIPATGATGRPLAITSAVRNTGVAPAGAFTVRFFLSSDDTLHPSDVLLGARTIAALGVGVTSTAVTTVTIPAATTPASYRVIAVVDALEQQAELSEANNALASAGAVAISLYRPELSVTTLTVPAAGATGRPLAITHAVRNAGPAPAGAFTVRFYLSADDTLDTGDVLLGSRGVGSLGAGVTSAAVTSVTIPATTTAPAGYHVIAAVDAAGQQTELDETNNTRASAGMVAINPYRPELGVTALTVPAAGALGRPLAITSAVRNAGPAPAGAFAVRFYLSADDTLDGSDVLLGARIVAALGAGVTSQALTTVTIPATTEPATYRVIAVVDALEQQTELTETNNTSLSTGTVAVTLFRPDLTVTTLTTPVSGTAGRPLAITSAVRNAGPAPAGAFTVRFYLSADDTLDGTDVLLGARTIASLGAGVTSSAVTSVTVPAATAPASYRIIAVVDALEQQAELIETNNTQMLTGTVAIGGA